MKSIIKHRFEGDDYMFVLIPEDVRMFSRLKIATLNIGNSRVIHFRFNFINQHIKKHMQIFVS